MATESAPVGSSTSARSALAWARLLGAAAILVLLVWRVGTGPFLDGLRTIDTIDATAALGIGAVTTVCAAWRWQLVAAGLGVRLRLGDAVQSYYRSQFLNTTLPGGVLGDVHRAVHHGRHIGDVTLGVRAVVTERLAGQAVLVIVVVSALAVLPSPVRAHLPLAAGTAAAVLAVAAILAFIAHRGTSRWAALVRRCGRDLRDGMLERRWMGVLATSGIAVAGHLATFLLAARSAGSTAPLPQLAPLALLALLAMAMPVNIAGWGPREGVAAWAHAAVGLTAAQGVATSVTYGVLAFVATLPGAAVLLLRRSRRRSDGTPAIEPNMTSAPAKDGAHA